jgi:hypothetical protein
VKLRNELQLAAAQIALQSCGSLQFSVNFAEAMYAKSERAVIRAQLVAAPMYSGPIEPGKMSYTTKQVWSVAQIRTILSNKDGMVVSAIQQKLSGSSGGGTAVALRRLLGAQNGMPNCWTRRDVPTYDSHHNKTGKFKTRYFHN